MISMYFLLFAEVGVSTLKQLALTKGAYVPTLNVMVPYLDFSSNQEYLVKRIKGTQLLAVNKVDL